jgi:ElaB/YqjD/DUF883 family membrane-anchored ribosome-binding protein
MHMNDRPVFDALFAGVDDLIRRVADVDNPDIRRIRARVYGDMMVAKNAIAGGASAVTCAPPQSRAPADDFADDSAQTLGVALLVGLGVGFITSLQQS